MAERLQKIVARAGLASRRAAEDLVTAGRVRVNGRIVTELGAQADPRADRIEVDGRLILAEDPVYIVLHKPRDVVSTMSDPEGRPTVAELLRKVQSRVFPVGRLDFATSGVLLVTNDGDFAHGMLHPRRGVPKTYVVKVRGHMNADDLDVWRKGIVLEDGKTLPAEVHLIRYEEDRSWIEITIQEGRNQQIRRMGEATGFFVMRLARTSFAGITSEGLRPGQFRDLNKDELLALREAYGVPKRVRGVERSGTGVQGMIVQRGDDRGERKRAARDPRAPGISPVARRNSATPRTAPSGDERRGPPPERRGPSFDRDEHRGPPGGDDRRPSWDEGRAAAPRDDRRPAFSRDDRRGPPRDDRRPAFARDDRRGPPRDDRRPAVARDDRRGPPREDRRPAFARDDRSGPPRDRDDRRPAPRDDRRGPPRDRDDRRPAAPRDDRRPAAPRDDRRGPPRERDDRRPAAPRDDRRPAAPRDDRRGPPRERDDRRAAAPRDDRRPAAPRTDRRPAAARDERRPAAPRDERRPAPRRGR